MLRHLRTVETRLPATQPGIQVDGAPHTTCADGGRSSDGICAQQTVSQGLGSTTDGEAIFPQAVGELDTRGTDSETGALVVAPLLADMRAVAVALDRVYALLDALLAEGSSSVGSSAPPHFLSQPAGSILPPLTAARPRVSSDLVGASPRPIGAGSLEGASRAALPVLTPATPAADATTGAALTVMAALPAAVELLSSCLQSLIHHWDAIVRTHAAAAAASLHGARTGSMPLPTPSLEGTSSSAFDPPTSQLAGSGPRLQLSLSNIDALAYNTAAFALTELVRAVADMAACIRGLTHARNAAVALR